MIRISEYHRTIMGIIGKCMRLYQHPWVSRMGFSSQMDSLVGGFNTSERYESWDDYSQLLWEKTNVPNHQPAIVHLSFETQWLAKNIANFGSKFQHHHISGRSWCTDNLSPVCEQLATMANHPCSPGTWSIHEKSCLPSSPGIDQICFEWCNISINYRRDDEPRNRLSMKHWQTQTHGIRIFINPIIGLMKIRNPSYPIWIPDIFFWM